MRKRRRRKSPDSSPAHFLPPGSQPADPDCRAARFSRASWSLPGHYADLGAVGTRDGSVLSRAGSTNENSRHARTWSGLLLVSCDPEPIAPGRTCFCTPRILWGCAPGVGGCGHPGGPRLCRRIPTYGDARNDLWTRSGAKAPDGPSATVCSPCTDRALPTVWSGGRRTVPVLPVWARRLIGCYRDLVEPITSAMVCRRTWVRVGCGCIPESAPPRGSLPERRSHRGSARCCRSQCGAPPTPIHHTEGAYEGRWGAPGTPHSLLRRPL